MKGGLLSRRPTAEDEVFECLRAARHDIQHSGEVEKHEQEAPRYDHLLPPEPRIPSFLAVCRKQFSGNFRGPSGLSPSHLQNPASLPQVIRGFGIGAVLV